MPSPFSVPLSVRAPRRLAPLEEQQQQQQQHSSSNNSNNHNNHGASVQSARGARSPPAALPRPQHFALEDPLGALALEDWHRTHREHPGAHVPCESPLLACEVRLRKLDLLAQRLRPPNLILTGVVCDLLQKVLETLPPPVKAVCDRLMYFLRAAMYSEEPASAEDVLQLSRVADGPSDKLPYFAVMRRQADRLNRLDRQSRSLQQMVNSHLEQRRSVLDFIGRLQGDERLALQSWLFHYWVLTSNHRRSRVKQLANTVLRTPEDVVTPFLGWRLLVYQSRLNQARKFCELTDLEASKVATRITEVEIESAEQQKELQKSLDASALLKGRCAEEQKEHDRLQKAWDETRPELLLEVLGKCLEFLFELITSSAKLKRLFLRKMVANKDPTVLTPSRRSLTGSDGTGDEYILQWLNYFLCEARRQAKEQLALIAISSTTLVARSHLEIIKEVPEVHDLQNSLADSVVLTALMAVLRARRDGRELSALDLACLEERDLEMRAERLCTELRHVAPSARAQSLLSPIALAAGDCPGISKFLAATFLHDPMLPVCKANMPADDKQECQRKLKVILQLLEDHAGEVAWEPPDDPSPLLHGAEDFQALSALSPEQLLLRWVNLQLASGFHRPIENFRSDLQDGEAIALLLSNVAPEAYEAVDDPDERLNSVVAAAARCTELELLTPQALMEGQSDLLAAFLAELFLSRSNLAARPNSLLAMHLGLLEQLCIDAYGCFSDPEDQSKLMKMCNQMDVQWGEFILAAQTVDEAAKAMEGVNTRMQAFLGDTLSHRAQGRPRVMLDAKEAREFMFYTSLHPNQLQTIFPPEAVDPMIIARLEEVLKKHFHFLREVFRHYAIPTGVSGGFGITLEGLMKLYQDCKLRSKVLAPRHLEVLFCERLDQTASSQERVLTPSSFISILVCAANMKFKDKIDQPSDQLNHLIEIHLRPHACQETASLFQSLAYSPNVRSVLESHAKELKIIFQLYATMDTSTAEAMQRVNTMNIEEFRMLLNHCDMLDATFTENAMHEIFEGIQQSATEDGPDVEEGEEDDDDVGIDDDEELSLSEFFDGLVAVAAYKFPDPFVAFDKRVNSFILKLFAQLQRHWSRKRISPQVDNMLNALQKKLRH